MSAGEPAHKLVIHYNKRSDSVKDVRSEEYKHQELMNDVFERVLKQHPSNINLYLTVKVPLPGSMESMELKTDDDMKFMFHNYKRIQNIHLVLSVSVSPPTLSVTVVAPPEQQQPEGQSGRLGVPQPNTDLLIDAYRLRQQAAFHNLRRLYGLPIDHNAPIISPEEMWAEMQQLHLPPPPQPQLPIQEEEEEELISEEEPGEEELSKWSMF